jgi:hypothetical protein
MRRPVRQEQSQSDLRRLQTERLEIPGQIHHLGDDRGQDGRQRGFDAPGICLANRRSEHAPALVRIALKYDDRGSSGVGQANRVDLFRRERPRAVRAERRRRLGRRRGEALPSGRPRPRPSGPPANTHVVRRTRSRSTAGSTRWWREIRNIGGICDDRHDEYERHRRRRR